MTETLFPGFEPPTSEPEPSLSPDRRRTKRQADMIAIGRHPLTGGALHELASRHRDASAPKDDPFTCGSCYFPHDVRLPRPHLRQVRAGRDTTTNPGAGA
jgi:hypothetical protein